jgi:uncharacterized membrane protein YozB (DUF420 family)
MLTAGALVVAFLLSYVAKVLILGHEDLSVWSVAALRTLHLHELCVSVMLIAGAVAVSRAWRMRSTRTVTRSPDDPVAPKSLVTLHRRSGWTAVLSALLGFATAGFVLYGMYARL